MEHGPSIDDFPIKTCIYKGLSMAMLVIINQMVFTKWMASQWQVSLSGDKNTKTTHGRWFPKS